MKISIIGTNGMLSACLTKGFYAKDIVVDTYGLDRPVDYSYSSFTSINLLKESLDYERLLSSDMVIYAAGAGVQAALNTNSFLMYSLNVNVPIQITIALKERNYQGIFLSFGTYMEIGLNDDSRKIYTENDIIASLLPVTNDYALSKRLFTRYMKDLTVSFTYWHFILPNLFSFDDIKPGTRLIPYVLQYVLGYKNGLTTEKPSFSAGTQMRQFILMEEIIEVLMKSVHLKMKSGVYNIGGGEFLSIRQLIEKIFQSYGVACEEVMFGKEVRRDNDIKSLQIDGSKLLKQIDFLPIRKIDDIFKNES